MTDKDRDIPAIPSGIDSTLRKVLEPMREAVQRLMGTRGDAGSQAVRWGDLEGDGLASATRRKLLVKDAIADAVAAIPPSTGTGTGTGAGTTYTPDLTQPPQPTGLVVTAGFSSIMVEWDAPAYSAGHGHKQTNIYAVKQSAGDNTAYTINDAVRVDSAPGGLRLAVLASELVTKWRVWVRWESVDGVQSPPAGGINGIVVTTGQNVPTLLQLLNQQISASQLASALSTRIDLIDAPATTAGSVAAKVKAETDARVAAITQEVGDRNTAITAGVNTAKSYTESWAYSKQAADQAIAASATTVTSAYQLADTGTLNSAKAYVQGYTYTQAGIDGALTTLSNQLTASFTQADTTALNSAKSYTDSSVSTYAYSKAQTDDAIAYQISQISASAGGGNKTYSQPSAPTSGLTSGDLWYDSDDGNKPYRYDGTTWQLTTDTRLTNVMAAVATEQEVRANETGWLSALYSVRVQLTEGGRTVIGGFGIAGTSSPTAGPTIDFGVQADKFWIGAPAGSTGVADVKPFVVQTSDELVNGVTIPAGVYMDAAYIKNLSVAVARLGEAWIDDAKIVSMSAGKIVAGSLAAGVEITAGDRLKISGDGWIESYSASGFSRAADYVRMDAGNVRSFKYVPAEAAALPYSMLTRVESGVAQNSVDVLIPGYWTSQPKVIVSPNSLTLYKQSFANQDQAIQCSATALTETAPGSMRWQFKPVATLTLASGNGSAVLSSSSGTVNSDTYTSATFTTPPNCASIVASMSVLATQGTGSGGVFYYRNVTAKVQYFNGSVWVDGASSTVGIGATTTAQATVTVNQTFPSSAAWQWRVVFTASNPGGTFGAPSFQYSSETTGTNTAVLSVSDSHTTAGISAQSSPCVLPASTLNTGWEIYEITYYATLSGDLTGSVASGTNYGYGGFGAGEVDNWSFVLSFASGNYSNTTFPQTAVSRTKSGSNLSYNTNYCAARAYATAASGGTSTVSVTIRNAYAVIRRRTPVGGSTTPSNSFTVSSYTYALTAAQQLAAGTLNWLAMGD